MSKTKGYPSIDRPWLKYYDEKLFDYNFPHMNIYDYMKELTYDNRDEVAITYYGKEITYNELYLNVERVSRFLIMLGVKEQARIVYLMPNIPETAYFFYATAKIGAIADFVDPRPDSVDSNVSARKMLSIIREEKADFVVSLDQCYLAMLKPIEYSLKEFGIGKIVLVSAETSMDKRCKINFLQEKAYLGGYRELKRTIRKQRWLNKAIKTAVASSCLEIIDYEAQINRCENVVIPNVKYSEEWLVAIVHSSGTTGTKPKPIPLTHENLNAYIHNTWPARMPTKARDKALHMLPYFAAYGLVNVVHSGFCHLNNMVQIPEFRPEDIGKLVVKHKPQTIIGTPAWFSSFMYDDALKNADLSFLTMVTYGGDSMDEIDEERVNQFLATHGCKNVLTKGHGMSECCGCATFAANEYNELGTVGIPLPYTIYAIVNPETREMIRFEEGDEFIEGELILASKTISPGILDEKEIISFAEYGEEKYILTRDIARMDRNGIITFLARSDRMFTRYDGFKYKPYEVEDVVKQKKGVRNCIIAPYEEKSKHGLMPIANLVVDLSFDSRKERVKFVEELIEELFIKNPDVSTRQIPAKIRFVDKMPLTANGKVDFKKISEYELDGSEINVFFEENSLSAGEILIY